MPNEEEEEAWPSGVEEQSLHEDDVVKMGIGRRNRKGKDNIYIMNYDVGL